MKNYDQKIIVTSHGYRQLSWDKCWILRGKWGSKMEEDWQQGQGWLAKGQVSHIIGQRERKEQNAHSTL